MPLTDTYLDVFLSVVHVFAWSIYVGGAICMEFVLNYAQQSMKPSQTAVVCEFSGKRYRWWSFLCLLALLATGSLMALRAGWSLDSTQGVAVILLVVFWITQMTTLGLLTFRFHPDMHARLDTSMTQEEMKRERARVGVAIVRMAATVRIELAVAVLAMLTGASLHTVA
ncbi:MAG: DUF2269 family protein [Gammaproteobacteria bacterium]|nr:DUF2269 family protein [Gammaproteobacteria bacterium]MBT4493636.1 DUF2269 family protein [Gammaproteobacteria bacterium]MBT7371932.1 DUF2269 family protein [Gammaproteobacteria bacterium]